MNDPVIINSRAFFLILFSLPEYFSETIYKNYYQGKDLITYEECHSIAKLFMSNELESKIVE